MFDSHDVTINFIKSRDQYEASCSACSFAIAGPKAQKKSVVGNAGFHVSRKGAGSVVHAYKGKDT